MVFWHGFLAWLSGHAIWRPQRRTIDAIDAGLAGPIQVGPFPGGDGAPMRLRQASGGWQTAGRAVPSGMKRRSTPV